MIDHIIQSLTLKEFELKYKYTKVEALSHLYHEMDSLNVKDPVVREETSSKQRSYLTQSILSNRSKTLRREH